MHPRMGGAPSGAEAGTATNIPPKMTPTCTPYLLRSDHK